MSRKSQVHMSDLRPEAMARPRHDRSGAHSLLTAGRADGSAPTKKVFAILQAVAKAERPLNLSELSVALGMTKPTTHRIARMLEGEGLLERDTGGRRYTGGRRLLEFALDIVATSVRSAPRHAILEALSQQVGETCNLGVMVSNHVVYIDRVEAKWPFGLRFEPGSRVPLHCTAIGKLFLSALPRHRQESIIGNVALRRYTDNTMTDPQLLMRELQRIRHDGMALDDQEFLAGVVCLALPIQNAAGQIIAGLAVSAPEARMSLKQAMQHVPTIRAAAQQLAETMAGNDDQPRPESSR